MLLNIDKPLKRGTLHNEFCAFVPKPYGTKLKPAERMGADGGWFVVASHAEAAIVLRAHLPECTLARCPRC